MTITVTTHGPAETKQLGEKIAKRLLGTEVLALVGELGGGKTAFTGGLARGLGIKAPAVSPTFVLERVYHIPKTRNRLHHYDAYRLSVRDARDIGLDEYLGTELVVIEWADRIKSLLPDDTIWIEFKHGKDEATRTIKISAPQDRDYATQGIGK